jgi:hypothetical protein
MRRQWTRHGLLVLMLLAFISVGSTWAYAQTYLPGAKFGANDDYFAGYYGYEDGRAMQDAKNAHLGVLRVWIYWFELQPSDPAVTPGGFAASIDESKWRWIEAKLAAATASPSLSIYAVIAYPPQWATGVPAPAYCYDNHYPPSLCQGGHPVSAANVRQFVSYAVTRLKGKVKYWGFANEPADTNFWTGDGTNGPTRTTPQLITNVLQPAYEEAKRADPGVMVVGPDEIAPNNFCYLLQNANQYFDIIGFHAYDQWNWQSFDTRLDDMKYCIDAYGQSKPVWLTEFGPYRNDLGDENLQATRLQSEMTSIVNRPWIKRALLYRLRGNNVPDFGIVHTDMLDGMGPHYKPAYTVAQNNAAAAGNWRPRVELNPNYQVQYITDATGGPNYDDYVLIANNNPISTTARLTFVFPDGSGTVQDYPIAANSRYTVRLPDVPGVGGEGPLSVAVQSLNPNAPLMSEHSTYWGAGYAGGRSTEGMPAMGTWYFAEGNAAAGDVFKEWLTVFNPNPVPINVTFQFLLSAGGVVTKTLRINEGPGRVRIKVNDLIPDGVTEHATIISALGDNGAIAGITAERTMEWFQDSRDGHSTPGVPYVTTTWIFAEGYNGGAYSTYIPISNPNPWDADVTVTFFTEGGTQGTWHQIVPAMRRATATAPAGFPIGSFAARVTSNIGVVAERVMYWNTSSQTWAGGSAGIGAPYGATHWLAPEGSMNSFFHTYILIANMNSADAHLTVRFLKTDGTVQTTTLTVPAMRRGTIDTAAYGLNTDFSTDVTSDQPVVVERSMYWGAEFYGGHITMARIVP